MRKAIVLMIALAAAALGGCASPPPRVVYVAPPPPCLRWVPGHWRWTPDGLRVWMPGWCARRA